MRRMIGAMRGIEVKEWKELIGVEMIPPKSDDAKLNCAVPLPLCCSSPTVLFLSHCAVPLPLCCSFSTVLFLSHCAMQRSTGAVTMRLGKEKGCRRKQTALNLLTAA
jgi:hypothetical protein